MEAGRVGSALCRRGPAVLLAAAVGAVALTLSDSSPASPGPRAALVAVEPLSPAAGGRVRIEARFRTATSGTFAVTGAIVDSGSLKATRRISHGRLELAEALTGKLGSLRIRAVRSCTGGAGSWQVVSGTGDYGGAKGGGRAAGGPGCAATTHPVRAVYSGTVRTPTAPPPPTALAQPGRFGGGTSQREEVVFDVAQGGRTLSGLNLAVSAPCEGPVGPTRVSIRIPASQEIGPDGSFSIPSPQTFWTGSVTGRFTSPTTAEGKATVATKVTVTSTNTTYNCSASISWTASIPPPTARPGRYCGFSVQGQSVCFDVAAGGREVTRFEAVVVIRCQPASEFELTIAFTGSAPIGGHLGFVLSGTSFEGLLTGTGRVSGLIDLDGAGASGTVSLTQPSFDHEGTRYTCGVAVARWQATRQG